MVARPGPAALCLAIALIAATVPVVAAAITSAPESSDTHRGGVIDAAERAHERAQRRAGRRPADFDYSLVRTGIAVAGLLVFVAGLRLRTPGRRGLARLRLLLLGGIAFAAWASYYQFFRLPPVELGGSDHFHYYVGSKYFAELGWFGLYECSLAALDEDGRLRPRPGAEARDLHSMRTLPRGWVRASGADCPERFSGPRWAEFRADVAYFAGHWPDHVFHAVWLDHGYHPTPIWNAIGAAIAGRAATSNAAAMHWLPRIDRFLVVASLGLIAWAFGLEIACLVAIMWGTGQLWRYAWVGDGFLRQLWWIASVGGLCLLRRGWPALGGAGLGIATGLRLFPGALPASYLLRAGRPLLSAGRPAAPAWRFALGAAGALALALVVAVWAGGQGGESLTGFVTKMRHFASVPSTNKMGLRVAAETLLGGAGPAARTLELATLAGFAVLLWRALVRCRDWEAAVLGVCAIPLLTQPTNYYFSFYVLALLLAHERPALALPPLLAGLAWNVNGLVLFREAAEFRGASFIAVALSFALVIASARSAPPARVEQHG